MPRRSTNGLLTPLDGRPPALTKRKIPDAVCKDGAMMPPGMAGVMAGRGYTIFDTGIGRCGIAWGDYGVVGVQLPEAREIETRRRLFRLYPEARELRPPLNVEIAIDGIAALLRGQASDLSDVTLDMTGIHAFNQRVYELTRRIPRGETRTYGDVAKTLGASGAAHSVAQAISRNPFMIIVPCHRVLEAGSYADKISPNGGAISKRRLLSIEGAGSSSSKTLFDVLLPVAPPRPQG
jgi:methylated-DNA-[protein]-cysteine S-methyltransferase